MNSIRNSIDKSLKFKDLSDQTNSTLISDRKESFDKSTKAVSTFGVLL